MNNLTIKQKLIFINMLSFIVILFFSAVIAGNSYVEYKSNSNINSLIKTSVHLAKLVHELQKERGASSGYLDSKQLEYKEILLKQKILTDSTLQEVKQTYTEDLDFLSSLENLRKQIYTRSNTSKNAIKEYTHIINNIIMIITDFSMLPQDVEIRNSFTALGVFINAKEKVGYQRALVTSVLATNSSSLDTFKKLVALESEEQTLLDIFFRMTTPTFQKELQDIQKQDSSIEVKNIMKIIFSQKDNYNIDSLNWFKMISIKIDALHTFEKKISSQTLSLSQTKSFSALNTFILIISITAIIFLYVVLISYTIALSISASYTKLQETISLIDENIILSETDLNGVITYASDAFCTISGYTKEELIGEPHNIVRHEDMPKESFRDLWKTIKENNTWRGEVKNKKKDGTFYWVKAMVAQKHADNGDTIGYIAIRQDITDKKIVEELSITDGLTNLFNRRHFNEIFPKVLNTAKRQKSMVCFLMLDVDFFKPYNDYYGHQKGDEALIKIAKCIKEIAKRANDYPFRLGGEEFGILFDANSIDDAINFSNTLKTNIQDLNITHEKNPDYKVITASLGLVCKVVQKEDTHDSMYKEADNLLYKAKESGRNKLLCNNMVTT